MSVFQKDPALKVARSAMFTNRILNGGSQPRVKQAVSRERTATTRQLLDDKSIDAVLIGTPEHWHARMVLDALAAGKDVYVEKPLCQTPEQGVELVSAEKTSKNIVQVGMQRRSYDLYLEGRKIIASGALGNIRMIRSWWLNNYLGGTRATKLEGPIDWEQWQGPIKKRVPLESRPFPKLAALCRLRRGHPRRSGRARFRWHSSA